VTKKNNDIQETWNIVWIPLGEIEIGEECQRKEADPEIESLIASIKEEGLIYPVTVRKKLDGGYRLIDGSRRCAAYRILDHQKIPCIVTEMTEEQAADRTYAGNAHRKPRHPAEDAFLFGRMRDRGRTQQEIAQKAQLPQSVVSDRLSLLKLPEEIRLDIGTKPDSPFKSTHGVLLAQLIESNGTDRDALVRRLWIKTRTQALTKNELRETVQIIRNQAEWKQLPPALQDLLLESRFMMAEMAQFFLHPEAWFEETKVGIHLNAEVKTFNKATLEQIILQTVAKAKTVREAREELNRRLRPSVPEPIGQAIFDDIAALIEQLRQAEYQKFKLPGLNPVLRWELRSAGENLIAILGEFINMLAIQTSQNQGGSGNK
jgi:ParB/RepB/Spo0J family partition protein